MALKIDIADELTFIMTPFTSTGLPINLISEQHGQDLAAISGNVQVLFQMKHSGNPEEYPLGKTDFREILRSFAESHLDMQRKGYPAADHFGIVTNRCATEPLYRLQQQVLTGSTGSEDDWRPIL